MPKRTDISKGLILGAALLVGLQGLGQKRELTEDERTERWETVPRVCGRLKYHHEKKKKDGSVEDTFESIRKAHLRLYRVAAGADCCVSGDLVAETVSGYWGKFGFKVKDGEYWLLIGVNGADYRMKLQQDKSVGDEESLCSDNTFTVEPDGTLQLGKVIRIVD